MKRLITLIVLLVASGFTEIAQAQLVKNSWSLGFGFTYPRFSSINITPLNSNYGGFASLQRNFSEHVGIRLKAGYTHMESQFIDPNALFQTTTTNSIMSNLDLMYYLVPCEPISPYIIGGVGYDVSWLNNYQSLGLDNTTSVLEYGVGAGLEWTLDESWKLLTEFSYHLTNNSELEGAIGKGEVGGRDSYIGVSLGLLYFLDKGEPSKYCQLYEGITQEQRDLTDYVKIEDMIVKHIPKEVTKEIVVEKPVKTSATAEKWVLIGNNFEFNKSTLTPESYPILYDAAKALLRNTDAKIEIHGYTDNIGTESYNKKLSERRAETVKDYLVSKGVAASRITIFDEGESNPVADNKTAEGRAMNRRIEFKIQ